MKNKNCRFCNDNLTKVFVYLGMSSLIDSFLTAEMLEKEETMDLNTHIHDWGRNLVIPIPEVKIYP